MVAAAIGVPALAASGATQPSTRSTDSRSGAWVDQRHQVINYAIGNARPLPKVKPRPAPARASRSSFRVPLGGSPRQIAYAMVMRRGWSDAQFGCLSTLWDRESGWDVYASNGSSGAYGIPQALPGYKMASYGADWRTNPVTQIGWGIGYIAQTYGTPCAALDHSYNYNYY